MRLSGGFRPTESIRIGLIVHLDEVNLDVTANPTGGLLGDLLCLLAGIDLGNLVGGILGLIMDLLGLDELGAIVLLNALHDFLNSLVIL